MGDKCLCIEIGGHLEDVKWLHWPRNYKPSTGVLAMGDWKQYPFIWLHYVLSGDELLEDDVLRSTDTRYWSIHDVQRYFVGELHCEKVLFSYQYPNLKMPTQLGSYFWKANTALKILPKTYLKELHMCLETTLKKLEVSQKQINRLVISDQLIKIDHLDYYKRKMFFKTLLSILSFQDSLKLVSLENLCCKRLEGVSVLQQLACFNSHSLKYLFLWRFVLPTENPILINYKNITGSGTYVDRTDSRMCFLRSLSELRNLRELAIEYAHIADGTGNALISLLPVLQRPHFRLQLICREDQVAGRADAADGAGGYDIPDTAWRRVHIACPDIYLFMAFYRIHDYDNLQRFLSPSLPLREAHVQLGIDLYMWRQESDLSCIIRHMAYRYSATLKIISIHHWRTSELPLLRTLELMPFLVKFVYVGRINEKDVRKAFKLIACGVLDRLKQISIQIQDTESRRSYWRNFVNKISEEYENIMKLYDIHLCLEIYKH